MASFIYQNLNSQVVIKLWNIECNVCLVIYQTKKIPDLYFSNQTPFDLIVQKEYKSLLSNRKACCFLIFKLRYKRSCLHIKCMN